jgi:isochorismate hydrolase
MLKKILFFTLVAFFALQLHANSNITGQIINNATTLQLKNTSPTQHISVTVTIHYTEDNETKQERVNFFFGRAGYGNDIKEWGKEGIHITSFNFS